MNIPTTETSQKILYFAQFCTFHYVEPPILNQCGEMWPHNKTHAHILVFLVISIGVCYVFRKSSRYLSFWVTASVGFENRNGIVFALFFSSGSTHWLRVPSETNHCQRLKVIICWESQNCSCDCKLCTFGSLKRSNHTLNSSISTRKLTNKSSSFLPVSCIHNKLLHGRLLFFLLTF